MGFMVMQVAVDPQEIARFCLRRKVSRLELFGSALRDDFGPDSDIDLLVSFVPGVRHGLFDWVGMKEELAEIFGRKVDLVSRRGIAHSQNRFRREAILGSARPLYVAG